MRACVSVCLCGWGGGSEMNQAGPLCSKALAPAGESVGEAGAFASQERTWRVLVEAPAKHVAALALFFSTALVSI